MCWQQWQVVICDPGRSTSKTSFGPALRMKASAWVAKVTSQLRTTEWVFYWPLLTSGCCTQIKIRWPLDCTARTAVFSLKPKLTSRFKCKSHNVFIPKSMDNLSVRWIPEPVKPTLARAEPLSHFRIWLSLAGHERQTSSTFRLRTKVALLLGCRGLSAFREKGLELG